MSKDTWAAVDRYFGDFLFPADDALAAAIAASDAAGLPPIAVTPAQGKLLHLLARLARARTVLEIGTLGGYSTIWLARALPPDGRVVTIEGVQRHADVARANLERAGVAHMVDLRVGSALDVLPGIERDGLGPFDLVFVDADKKSIPAYFDWALRLTRPGSAIVVDNVVRDGRIVDANSDDPDIHGVRAFAERLATETRVSATVVQTVGAKSYDGFALAIVND
jgi:predicted O-methyltransferase YrrM